MPMDNIAVRDVDVLLDTFALFGGHRGQSLGASMSWALDEILADGRIGTDRETYERNFWIALAGLTGKRGFA